ncbi:MAG TPA: hypothetical protein VMC80_03455 [Patescibacteria group bacterium]|nr:hypothetical protein [Patescibacteria group bacterium]
MRKIISQEEIDKKKKKRQIFVGGLLILIMLLSTAGYAFTQFFGNNSNTNNEQVVYNGIQFTKQNNLWLATLQGVQLGFSYNPSETGNINSSMNLTINDYSQQPLYIYSEYPDAEPELYRNLDSFILRRQYACPEGESNCPSDFPVKTCQNNFIILKESNSTSITQQGKCVFIEGKPEDITKTIDGFLFHIFGVQ